MTRKNDFQIRKDLVLGIVIDRYVKIVAPVGSAFIAEEYHLDLSPATIRNILAELEEEGYLMHPHTSAGRIPTQRGYRYYVDHLIEEIQLLNEEKVLIEKEYRRQVLELGALLEKTSEFISSLTHYTSIISIDGHDDKLIYRGTSNIVAYPESRDINKIRDILYALEEKERIMGIINRDLEKKIQIYIGQELNCLEINDCAMVISSYHSNKGLSGRLAVLGPTRMDYKRVISALDYFSELMSKVL